MAVYRFKISFEEHEEIYREIEIKSVQTFEDLHYAIQSSIGFDASCPASFYMSNDHWTKGEEIALNERSSGNGTEMVLMKDAVLKDWIVDPHQKIYYEFNSSEWTFFVELVRIFPTEDIRKKYPVCVKVNGEALKQRGTILPVKEDENESEELVETITHDYVEDESILDAETEEVIDEDEADAITGEGIVDESGAEEEV